MAAQLRLHLSIVLDVDAGANVAKESAVTGKSRNSGIIDPTICAIVSAEPVLNLEIFTGIKVVGVNFYTAFKIVAVHSFGPAVTSLLSQTAAGEGQPSVVKPDASPCLYRTSIS
jgi:hypothetical protein